MKTDGSAKRQVSNTSLIYLINVSPDGEWAAAAVTEAGGGPGAGDALGRGSRPTDGSSRHRGRRRFSDGSPMSDGSPIDIAR